MQIIPSLVCKSDIKEVYGNMLNPSFEKKVRLQKCPKEVDKCRNSVIYINHLLLKNRC